MPRHYTIPYLTLCIFLLKKSDIPILKSLVQILMEIINYILCTASAQKIIIYCIVKIYLFFKKYLFCKVFKNNPFLTKPYLQ